MTTEELAADWRKYAVVIDGKNRPLKELFMLSLLGADPKVPDAILFDTGGPQGAPAYLLKVGENGTDLISVNPQNPSETTVIGPLVEA